LVELANPGYLCVRCRRLLDGPEGCENGGQVLAITETAGREEIRLQSYSNVPRVRWLGANHRLRAVFAGSVITGLATFAVVALTGDDADLGAAFFISGIGGLLGLAVLAPMAFLVRLPPSFYRRQPDGALGPCPGATADAPRGRLMRSSKAELPGGEPLVRAVELRARGGQVSTLRLARCDALIVQLDDGRRAHVPAGEAVVSGDTGTYTELSLEAAQAWAERLGVHPQTVYLEEEEGPVPVEGGREFTLREGARVTLGSPLEIIRKDGEGAFRTAANRDLAPVGVPRLHALSG